MFVTGPRRAPDAGTSIQLGDTVRFREHGLIRTLTFKGLVTGWLTGGLVVNCEDGVARRVPINRAERV